MKFENFGRKLKKWFGFPVAGEYKKEVEKILLERLEELEMVQNKKSTVKKKAPVKKAPVKKTVKKSTPKKK